MTRKTLIRYKAEQPTKPSKSLSLNSTTNVLLEEWIWHQVAPEGWYVIKK